MAFRMSQRLDAFAVCYVVDNLLRKANFEASSCSRGRPECRRPSAFPSLLEQPRKATRRWISDMISCLQKRKQ